jgi:protein-S-isoprenylcysteine O-methyltransferase Ste14
MKDQRTQAWLATAVVFAFMWLALFLSAGTIRYWQAWVYLGVLAASSVPLMLYMIGDPVLLANRMKFGPAAEKRPLQKIIVASAGLPAVAAFILPGLDRRFGWSDVPPWLSIVGDLLVLLSMWMVYQVFKANSFGSATVDIVKDQSVIDTGPYAIVRNPMYSSAALYFVATAFALGSYWGLIPSALTILVLVGRLFDEEQFLARNLPGYNEYCAKVRWHLIPGIF